MRHLVLLLACLLALPGAARALTAQDEADIARIESYLNSFRSLESKFIQIVKPGDTLLYQGTVTEKKEEGGRRYVFVEFFAENQKGEKVIVGTARAAF